MKRRHFIIAAITALIIVVGFVLGKAGSSSAPVLVFKGYERAGTNAAQLAKLELRNTSQTPIWLSFGGEEFPLSPPFVEQPLTSPPKATNDTETNLYTLHIGHYFMRGEQVLPGSNFDLDFPLVSGQSPERVGISYYVGNFKDGNNFLDNVWIPLLDNNASLKRRVEFFWDKLKRRSRGPKLREVWCPQPLSFQTGDPTNFLQ